jgi:hypothetical protein
MRLAENSQQLVNCKCLRISYNLRIMNKNAPLAFRIPSDLKKSLQQIANREARSISQVCEILLTIGTNAYSKEGPKYLQHHLGLDAKQ